MSLQFERLLDLPLRVAATEESSRNQSREFQRREAELGREIDCLNRQVSELLAERGTLLERLEHLEADLKSHQEATLWRVTLPIRALVDWGRGRR